MKMIRNYFLLLLLTLTVCTVSHAQIRLRLNYDKDWKLTTPDSAVFIRACIYDTTNAFFAGPVVDMFPNGRLQMKGAYKLMKKEGEFTTYYNNGNVESSGMFQDNVPVGVWKFYNPDGTLKTETSEFQLPKKFEQTEKFEADSRVTFETYPALKTISYNGSSRTRIPKEKLYMLVEVPPEPIGGIAKLYSFVKKNTRYPVEARKQGITGNVMVQFIVEMDGSLSNLEVKKGIGGGCDEEAIRVITLHGKEVGWRPATQNGKPVKVRYVMPVKFPYD